MGKVNVYPLIPCNFHLSFEYNLKYINLLCHYLNTVSYFLPSYSKRKKGHLTFSMGWISIKIKKVIKKVIKKNAMLKN